MRPCPQCRDTGAHPPWCSRGIGAERKRACTLCGRPPGGIHPDACPRSRASQRALAALDQGPRMIYPNKGFFSTRGPKGKVKGGLNPGVPLVRDPKPRTAGGMPRGTMKVPTQWRDEGNTPRAFVTVDRARVAEVFLAEWGHVERAVTLRSRA